MGNPQEHQRDGKNPRPAQKDEPCDCCLKDQTVTHQALRPKSANVTDVVEEVTANQGQQKQKA
jgi:hypothetical protein